MPSCPFCGEAVDEGAERCPSCERRVKRDDPPADKQTSVFTQVLLALIVFAVLLAVVSFVGCSACMAAQ